MKFARWAALLAAAFSVPLSAQPLVEQHVNDLLARTTPEEKAGG
ncbi:MAG TPA: hypothetical protein VKR61_05085 [Bryobacteraceae bacterium]|nr:hypothetical protein [Bryobacteraceae bacterium]